MPNVAQPNRPEDSSPEQSGLPDISPDYVEQEFGENLDNIVPSYGYQMVPMIGIGGSAGALRSLQSFFESIQDDTGFVYVVVLHLAPDMPSSIPAIISKWTKMPVRTGEDGAKAEPNTVYVIPPGKHLSAINGHFKVTDLDREHGCRVTVDLFFRSLADSHGPHAVAVVLSGGDGDGAQGVKRIKERGGLTIAQDPDEAENNSMPRSAIGTGMVDWVLPSAEIPTRVIEYIAREKTLNLPDEGGPQPAPAARVSLNNSEATFMEILVFLRMRTGRDFSYYKRATILRRIARRMQINGVSDLISYLAFLRTHPGEAGALLKELLISVTNFFRDRSAFAELEKLIPKLFEGKTQGDTIRVWTPASATGEESYSMAMLLIEHARTLDAPPAIQVFGCDLDEDAIQTARMGLYPDTIISDVSEERLRRFFVKEHRGYRVRRELREMVLFAVHDLLKDAPFSRLDLISCRNILIYLNRDAQNRVLDIFHFGLKSEGYLFLGSSESVDETNPLFRLVDKKARIFQRKLATRIGLPVPHGPSTMLIKQLEEQVSAIDTQQHGVSVVVPHAGLPRTHFFSPATLRASGVERDRIQWGELHFKLIERFAPPSALVNKDYDIQHLSESCGRFLQLLGGEPTTNLLRLAHPALKAELRSALFRAAQTNKTAEAFRVPIQIDGKNQLVTIRVVPANDLAPEYLLVTFDMMEASGESNTIITASPAAGEPVVQHLERQLDLLKANLRDTVEQYEASTEELKASNEELQAMNEELRSATEELETSREELQSINEELSTVNLELKHKVEELGQANSDLNNLMGATAIATLFLDRNMNVMRFTQSAAPIFNLILSDIGRPLSNLQHRIEYPEMAADAEKVLTTLGTVEREVTGLTDRCYLARMLPYRTVEDRIGGVVLTFVDITERQRSLEELTRFNKAAVGRENRMIELKKEVNDLLERVGEPPRYSLDFLKEIAKSHLK
ncbi:MAG: CheR family methyltransferase [Verrucomicrobiales bacterium]